MINIIEFCIYNAFFVPYIVSLILFAIYVWLYLKKYKECIELEIKSNKDYNKHTTKISYYKKKCLKLELSIMWNYSEKKLNLLSLKKLKEEKKKIIRKEKMGFKI